MATSSPGPVELLIPARLRLATRLPARPRLTALTQERRLMTDDDKRKHLDLLQGAISRMAGDRMEAL